MALFFHELRQNRLSLIIWSAILSFVIAISVFIYPEMSSQMNEINDMFAQMGSFSDAFGMNELNFGEFIGYFGVECGNSLGLGAAFFAAILGVSALAKEQKDGTAEFLLTHPISRASVVTQKLLALIAELLILNTAVFAVSVGSAAIIGETSDIPKMALILLAQFLTQFEIAAVTFCVSAFIRRGGLGIGLGVAAVFYFLNILANIDDSVEFLKYLTPFSFADSAYIIENTALDPAYLAVGALVSAAAIATAFLKYTKKDIL